MEVESGRPRRWRLASSVTPPSLALGLPFGISRITGNGRAGVTLAASCRARAPVLEVSDEIGWIGRPFALFVCVSLGLLTRALALSVLGASDTLQPSWTSEFQKMSPPIVSSPRHRQTVTVTMTDKRVRQRRKRRSRHRRDGLLSAG